MSMNSAGILPVIFEKDKTYILLGQESNGSWSGFAGGQDGDETPQETAFREFHEETADIFTEVDYAFIRHNCFHVFNTKTPSGKLFVMYSVDFSKLDTSNTSLQFQFALKNTTNAYQREKTTIQWVEISNIFRRKLRHSFYKDIEKLLKAIKEHKKDSIINNLQIK